MNEQFPKPKQDAISKSDALSRIEAIRCVVHAMGAVDTEPSFLNQLSSQVDSGNLSPTDAVAQAEAMLASRQDYH